MRDNAQGYKWPPCAEGDRAPADVQLDLVCLLWMAQIGLPATSGLPFHSAPLPRRHLIRIGHNPRIKEPIRAFRVWIPLWIGRVEKRCSDAPNFGPYLAGDHTASFRNPWDTSFGTRWPVPKKGSGLLKKSGRQPHPQCNGSARYQMLCGRSGRSSFSTRPGRFVAVAEIV